MWQRKAVKCMECEKQNVHVLFNHLHSNISHDNSDNGIALELQISLWMLHVPINIRYIKMFKGAISVYKSELCLHTVYQTTP